MRIKYVKLMKFMHWFYKIHGSSSICFDTKTRETNSGRTFWYWYNLFICAFFFLVLIVYCRQPANKIFSLRETMNIVKLWVFIFFLCIMITTLLKFNATPKKIATLRSKFAVVNQYAEVDAVILRNFLNLIYLMIPLIFNEVTIFSKYYFAPGDKYTTRVKIWRFTYSMISKVAIVVPLQLSALLDIICSCVKTINKNISHKLQNCEVITYVDSLRMRLKIKKWMNFYCFLSELSHDVSVYYSLPLLLCIILAFLAATTYMFLILEFIIVSNDAPVLTYINIIWYYCFPILIVIKRVSGVLNECERTKKLITEDLKDVTVPEIEKNLRFFLDCLTHQAMKFKVYDYFSLGQTLSMSFVGTTVTYLVVLIHFFDFNYSQKLGIN